MTKTFRTGAIGAYLDEYEKALSEFKQVVELLPDSILPIVIDPHTSDENCRSVQTILSHVVHSGYGYANSIHNLKGPGWTRPIMTFHSTVKEYLTDLNNLFIFTEEVFQELDENELEQLDSSLKIKTGWGQEYDINQMAEHAIVHVLRHRRQLEKIRLQLFEQKGKRH
jgi:hypothetical protein